ncbi:MAG TPA: hypothetical protein VM571_04205 [Noviherbaspirillum sp.]|nr:hypothetical protein [Noviherbaspirillum sp.]
MFSSIRNFLTLHTHLGNEVITPVQTMQSGASSEANRHNSGTPATALPHVEKKGQVLRTKERFPGTNHTMTVRHMGTTSEGRPIRAWELGKNFLLWTAGDNMPGRWVVIGHSGYRNSSKDIQVPPQCEVNVLGPHNNVLMGNDDDREMIEIVTGEDHAAYHYATVSANRTVAKSADAQGKPLKNLSGSDYPGHMKDLDIRKITSGKGEEPGADGYYRDIPQWLKQNQTLDPTHHCGVITARNRQPQTTLREAVWPLFRGTGALGIPQPSLGYPTLGSLLNDLNKAGIQISEVDLIACRAQRIPEKVVEEYDFRKG